MGNNFLLGTLKNIEGLAYNPHSADNRLILNLVSISGEWGEDSFSLGLVKKWEKAKNEFRAWYRGQVNFKLGNTHELQVQSDTTIVHLLCLDEKGKLDLVSFTKALNTVAKQAIQNKLNVHIQAVSKKDTKKVTELLTESLVKHGVNTFVYTAPVVK